MEIPREHQHQVSEEPTPDWVIRHPVKPPPSGDRGGSALELLLRDGQRNLETATYYHRIAFHLPNFVSVQTGSRIEIEFSPDVEKLLIHEIQIRRGDEVINLRATLSPRILNREEEMERLVFNGRLLVVCVPNDVRAGDVIDYSYSLQAIKPSLFGGVSGRFILQGDFSAEAIRCRLLYRADRTIYAMPHKCEVPAQTAYTETGLVDCRWEADGIKSREMEKGVPQSALPFGWIDYGEFPTWEEVAQSAARLFAASDEPLPAALATWLAQLQASGATPEQVILQIARYVQESVRYVSVSIDEHTHKPYPISVILERHYGDCKDKSILLCRLLREAGHEAAPVLVHSKLRGKATEGLPRPWAFNHAIVRLEHGEKTYWIDPTLAYQGGGLESLWHPPYGIALRMDSPGAALEIIPSSSVPNMVTHDECIKIRLPEGTAELRIIRSFTGKSADEMRAHLATLGLAELDRTLVTDYKQPYRKVALQAPSTSQDNREQNQITLTHSLLLSDFWTLVKGAQPTWQMRFPVHGIRRVLQVPENEKRILPFRTSHPLQIRASMEIRLTAAFKPQRMQGIVHSAAFQCKYYQETSSNSCRMNLEYASIDNQVMPRELPQHIQAIRQLADLTGLSVRIPERLLSRIHHSSLRR
jgi:hypothetical protein